MRINVTDLRVNDCLAEDVFNRFGLLVLSKGTVVTEHEIYRLQQHRIESVEIHHRVNESVMHTSENTFDQIQETILPKYEQAVAGVVNIFEKALTTGEVLEVDVQHSFQPLLDNCKQERDIVSLLLLLNNQDDYTYQHSVQVGMLSYYIAKWLDWDDERALFAGKAGFLHDIGKCRIPDSILNKPGKLTKSEFEEIKKHTQYGYEILRKSPTTEALALPALQHHERMDGSGYPYGLKGEQIDPTSRIVMIADIFCAMIFPRVYQAKRDMLSVLKELHRCSFGELEPVATHKLIQHFMPNFIGKTVTLTGGITGTIVMNHATEYFRPLVRTADGFIDLNTSRSFEITELFI
jgi:putative nucleotidyltransferase with HDIG domain